MLFLIMEISAVILMFSVINFSHYFIDLSPVLAFGIAFYAVVKVVDITGKLHKARGYQRALRVFPAVTRLAVYCWPQVYGKAGLQT